MIIMVPLTKGYWSVVDGIDGSLCDISWCYNQGYAIRSGKLSGKRNAKGRPLHAIAYLHRMVMERKLQRPILIEELVDHIDGDKLNNQRDNLRVATDSQNVCNKRMQRNNTTGYRGVQKSGKKWSAGIDVNGIHTHLGVFATPEEAAQAYDVAALHYHGEYARLNILPSLGRQDIITTAMVITEQGMLNSINKWIKRGNMLTLKRGDDTLPIRLVDAFSTAYTDGYQKVVPALSPEEIEILYRFVLNKGQ